MFIDRTYHLFATDPQAYERDALPAIRYYSLSKAYALAGQRLGVLHGPRDFIAWMRERQWHLHIDCFSLQLLIEVCRSEWPAENVAAVITLRDRLAAELEALGLPPSPSQGNFLFVRHTRASEITAYLEQRGILVFDTTRARIAGGLRISTGSPEMNAQLLAHLREWSDAHR
jgi:histidinol-phosphate/aromatic aminotransferase/cobyric acid decarboxylase-like protein